MGKEKKEKRRSEAADEDEGKVDKVPWEDKIRFLSPISQPLASKKLARKLYKVAKKARQAQQLVRGVKDAQKRLRKGEKGIVVLAGDVSPIDVICHFPVVCEDAGVPYCYTPSKQDLGTALGSTSGAVMVLIKPHEDYKDLYEEAYSLVKEMPLPL